MEEIFNVNVCLFGGGGGLETGICTKRDFQINYTSGINTLVFDVRFSGSETFKDYFAEN